MRFVLCKADRPNTGRQFAVTLGRARRDPHEPAAAVRGAARQTWNRRSASANLDPCGTKQNIGQGPSRRAPFSFGRFSAHNIAGPAVPQICFGWGAHHRIWALSASSRHVVWNGSPGLATDRRLGAVKARGLNVLWSPFGELLGLKQSRPPLALLPLRITGPGASAPPDQVGLFAVSLVARYGCAESGAPTSPRALRQTRAPIRR